LASTQNGRVCSSMKTIIAISVISMLALGMSIFPTGVYAQGSAYTKGYKDALCDAVSCNGHGYEPSCPGDHSSEYCNNYRDGYTAGWDASTNGNSDGQQPPMNSPPPPFSQAPNQGQGAANGGNNINGNNNTINQLQSQQEQSGNGNSGNGGNGDKRGQLSQCKAFCTGVQ